MKNAPHTTPTSGRTKDEGRNTTGDGDGNSLSRGGVPKSADTIPDCPVC